MTAMNIGQHIGSPTLNRMAPSLQVRANNTGLNFSEVLGAGANGSPANLDETVENKLTGMLLGNFVQLMLPKETEGLFGERRFADMWSSFLADALADDMSDSGKIDLRFNSR